MAFQSNLMIKLAILGLLATGPARANLLLNGNFELGTIADANAITDWTTGNIHSSATSGTLYPNLSEQIASLIFAGISGKLLMFNTGDSAPGGTLSQSFATVIGTQYQLSFGYGELGSGTQGVNVTVSGAGTDFSQSITASTSTLHTYSFSFTASGSSETLTFADSAPSTFGGDGLLDNVLITGPAVTAVPEPASVLLLLGGILVLATRRRIV